MIGYQYFKKINLEAYFYNICNRNYLIVCLFKIVVDKKVITEDLVIIVFIFVKEFLSICIDLRRVYEHRTASYGAI